MGLPLKKRKAARVVSKANGHTPCEPRRRTRAAQEMAKLVAGGLQQQEIAVACDRIDKGSVTRWLSGEQIPSGPNKAILKRKFGILLSWWSSDAIVEAAAAAPAESLEALEELTLRQQAIGLQREIQQIRADTALTSGARRQKILTVNAEAVALRNLGRITGETKDLSEAQIVKTPAWSRVCTVILKALTPWPEAVLAVGHALRDLDSEGR